MRILWSLFIYLFILFLIKSASHPFSHSIPEGMSAAKTVREWAKVITSNSFSYFYLLIHFMEVITVARVPSLIVIHSGTRRDGGENGE